MTEILLWLLLLVLSAGIAFTLGQKKKSNELKGKKEKTEDLLSKAKRKYKEILVEAKEKALQELERVKEEEKQRRKELQQSDALLQKKERRLESKLDKVETSRKEIEDKKKNIEEKLEEIEKKKDEWLDKLEEISHLTSDEAKDLLLKTIEGEVKAEAQRLIKEVKEAVKEESDRLARHHIVTAMQRCAADHASEITVTSVSLPNDEMKGRVIGREGRNIRTIERLTGVTITVDDTPESVTLSSFNPVRREVARISLEKLVKDGRIHPARIEEEVKKAKINVAREIIKSGEEAAFEAGVAGLSREVIKLMGKLKYRTSYGQNVLQHSVEVAKLSALLAGELGANADIARKAGFLHDIGKAVDQEMGGGHAIVTGEVLKRLGLSEEVVYAAKSHHEDFPLQTTEDYIVQIADAISGARPGARRDSHERFIQRIKEIEQVANSFNGVDSSYAIHAGREIRVLVDPEEVDDLSNMRLCRDIAMKIQDTLKYPGQIKVVTLRETRAEEVAK